MTWLSLLLVWLLAAAMMTAGWRWQRRRDNAGIVDVLWSVGLGGGAIVLAATGNGAIAPRVLLAILGGLWGLRLAWHLWARVRSEGEDGRYRALRAHWGGDQRRGLAAVVAGLVGSSADVSVPALPQRRAVDRSAGVALARRRLPRPPAQHAYAVSVVSQALRSRA